MIVGIDNGLSGGICLLSDHNQIIEMMTMPCVVVELPWGDNENQIDGYAVAQWIKSVTCGKPCTIVIEECPKHANRVSTMRSMAISYGILNGAIKADLPEYDLKQVRSGNPKDSWQRAILGKWDSGKTKERAIQVAKELFPYETFLPTKRHRTPDLGLIDSALIAYFWRNKSHIK